MSVKGEEVVKCACGLPMRQKKWPDHWRSCKFGSSVPVIQEDIDNLEAHETQYNAYLNKLGYKPDEGE